MANIERAQPPRRTDFRIAIICALPIECDAVEALFDRRWDVVEMGKAKGDQNTYSAGRIGIHDVVLVFMPGMGKARSASVAAALRSSFTNVCLALVVGICGASPRTVEGDAILLGDVIISNRVVQADFGRQFSDGFRIKETGLDGLARPGHAISSFLSKLSGLDAGRRLADRTHQCLQHILEKDGFEEWQYPATQKDILYKSSYRHKHQSPSQCAICRECTDETDGVCEDALTATCEQLGCADDMILERQSELRASNPRIYQGVFASGDQVIRSAPHRDKLLENHKAIGFEMEGAGVWDSIPTIVIKGVSDYADCHKNKAWQRYAAASAAATAKSLLAEWTIEDDESDTIKVPFNPNGIPIIQEFIGRDDELAEISQALSPGQKGRPKYRKIFAVYGLGGIGKTQIAARYVYVNRHRFSAIIWIDGSTIDSVKSSLSSFASRITPRLTQNSTTVDEKTQAVLAWLASAENTDWLLVFDNVDLDIDAKPPDPQAYRIRDFFPPAEHGSILITSRLQSVYRLGNNKKIAKLSREDSVKLVEKHLGRSIDGDKDAEAVIEKLDGLPLALAMAASFIRESGMTFEAYQKQYESTWSELLEQQDEHPLHEYAQRPILATWHVSYAKIEHENTDAARLLKLFSFFNNNGLTQDVLKIASELHFPESLDADWYAKMCKSSLSFARPLGLLLRYSLIEQEAGYTQYATHSVLHEWIYDMVIKGPQYDYQTICNLAAHLLANQVPSNQQETSYWPTMRNLAPHADTFGRRLKTSGKQVKLLPDNLFRIGRTLVSCAVLPQAEFLYLKAIESREEAFGQDDTLTLEIVEEIGSLYHKQDRFDEAEQMFIRVLQGRERALGQDHESTITTVYNLGSVYLWRGKFDKSKQMFKRALRGCVKVLGPDHKLTIDLILYLAKIPAAQGKREEAEQMSVLALHRHEAPGQDHASELDTIDDPGLIDYSQGKLDKAEQTNIRALQDQEKALGRDHTLTLLTVTTLGYLYCEQGKLEKAEQMYVRALQSFEKVLGRDHTSTLDTVSKLGNLYYKQGRLEEAEQMFIRGLHGFEKALGRDHTKTLYTVCSLGPLYREQGRLDEAEQMFIRGLQGFEKALGRDHISTLYAVSALIPLYHEQGRLDEAEELHERLPQGKRQSPDGDR